METLSVVALVVLLALAAAPLLRSAHAMRHSAVLLKRSQLIESQRFSPMEQLSTIVPQHLKNQPDAALLAHADNGDGVILDSWQSARGPLILIGKDLSTDCCERCVVRVSQSDNSRTNGSTVLYSTMNVRRVSDLAIECLFRNQYSVESFLADDADRRAFVTVEMRGLHGSMRTLASVALVNASDVVADNLVGERVSSELAPLCACTVVMNRNQFLREWIVYHHELGVEQFFFYRNGGERLDEALLPLLDRGDAPHVDSYFWGHLRSQRQAFAHCMARVQDRCEWAMFVDVDEFVVPASPRLTLTRIVARTQSDIIELPANVFAASTNSDDPSALVIESSTRFFTPASQVNAKKSLVRTRAAKLANNIHTFELNRSFRTTGSICAPQCASALASLSHFRFINWALYMRRTLDGVAGDVGLWRVPRLLSVLKPSLSFVREATLESGRFDGTDDRLLQRARTVRAALEQLRHTGASEQTRKIRALMAQQPRSEPTPLDVERATLSADEVSAVAADASALVHLVAHGGSRHLLRTAPDGTALAVLLLPA